MTGTSRGRRCSQSLHDPQGGPGTCCAQRSTVDPARPLLGVRITRDLTPVAATVVGRHPLPAVPIKLDLTPVAAIRKEAPGHAVRSDRLSIQRVRSSPFASHGT